MRIYRRKCRNRRGFVLIDLLLTMMIVMMLIPVILMMITVLSRALVYRDDLQDAIAMHQLEEILLISYEKEVDTDTLKYEYQGREMRLSLVNGNLIIQPGTQIILDDIDSASFKEDENTIRLQYTRGDKQYDLAIASKS